MSSIDRMPTGIPGLNEMIEGGFPVPSLILVAGDAGAGKTTLCTQFLCQGAKLGEPGLCFLTFGEPSEWVLDFISTFDFVDKRYFGNKISYVELEDLVEVGPGEHILQEILREIERFKARRIVFENISLLKDVLKHNYRRFLCKLSNLVKEREIVALVTGDTFFGEPYPAEVAQIADGIILLQNTEVNSLRRRSIEVLKMCGTSHHLGKYAVDISARGLTVYPGL